jgi:ABC-type transport system involved in multi-copper enzyme maturation permease subunit
MGRYWFSWAVLALLIVILALQVNGKLDELAELEASLSASSDEPLTPFGQFEMEGDRWQAAWLRQNLCYPAFTGYVARLSTGFGWFAVILFTAVMTGEDFYRRTLRSILVRGVGRTQLLLTRCIVLWLATGVGVAVIVVLAAVAGPYVHAQVTDDPVSLEGLGDALLSALRAWLTCLPFVVTTLFLAVLARHAGPALGMGLGLHFIEIFVGAFLPAVEAIYAATGADVPLVFRWLGSILGVMLGYNADVVLHWGPPSGIAQGLVKALGDAGEQALVPTAPWRAVAFLAAYTLLSLGLAVWVFRRRDLTYGS